MTPEYFDREEAIDLLKKYVRAIREFADVPVGTYGRVVGFDGYPGGGKYAIIIQWELIEKNICDWFSKRDFEGGLEVVV